MDFEAAIEQLRRSHETLPDNIPDALALQERVQRHVTKLVNQR